MTRKLPICNHFSINALQIHYYEYPIVGGAKTSNGFAIKREKATGAYRLPFFFFRAILYSLG